MDRGLVAPLSPNEEIALRRVAYGSSDVPARHVARLVKLALVAADETGLRLTDVGVRRVRQLAGAAVDEGHVIWRPILRPEPALFEPSELSELARRKLRALRKQVRRKTAGE